MLPLRRAYCGEVDTTARSSAFAKSLDELVNSLGTDLEAGLKRSEAARRLQVDGMNELTATPPVPRWRKALSQFHDPLIYLLLVAVAISMGAWALEGASGLPIDAIVIIAIVVANAIIGFAQESRAEQAVAALERMSQPKATVVRDGMQTEIAAAELVAGDVLVLGEGDQVGADARVIRANGLRVAEATLTGESTPVSKNPGVLEGMVPLGDRTNMVFGGTAVTQGSGLAVVTGTGMQTEIGSIANLLRETQRTATPLEKEVAFIGKALGIAVIGIALIVMATIWLINGVNTASEAVEVLLLGVSLAVAAVPEGLPAILSAILSIGVQQMSKRNAIVKRLNSVETLGSASVICTDKTGTLTRNQMTIQEIRTASGNANVTGIGYEPVGQVIGGDEPQRRENELVLLGGSLASNAALEEVDGNWRILGDPTEAAFLVAERKLDDEQTKHSRFTRVGEVPFTSERKLMSTLYQDHGRDEQMVLLAKGAPDVLLRRCTGISRGEDSVPLDETTRAAVLTEVEEMSWRALRTVGVAYRLVGNAEIARTPTSGETVAVEYVEPLENDLIYVGTVGMIDPAREEAANAIAAAQQAGIRVIMITGDHPSTALRIAQDLGITGEEGRAVTGQELNALTEQEFLETVREVNVYARVEPAHKLYIVDALRADDEVVAMTGDGVNDAPALKSANIGVAMGAAGTEVAKQAGSMILSDDNFATIVAAVEQGRLIFDNIKKSLRYLLSSNMGEVLTVFFGVVLAGLIGLKPDSHTGLAIPLLATQILWINLITDSGPALALGVDPQTDKVMGRPPRRPTDRVINASMWATILWVGLVMALSTLITMDVFLPGGLVEGSESLAVARTAGFSTIVFAQLFNVFSARSETSSAFHRLFTNKWLWGAVILGAVLQVLVVQLPLLQRAFGTATLELRHWVVAAGLGSMVLWAEEIRKLLSRAIHPRKQVVAR